ncbi:hypothetical protein BH10BAC6_BH10BAC6_03990 [soil metagenome]
MIRLFFCVIAITFVWSCSTTKSTAPSVALSGRTWYVESVRTERLSAPSDSRSPQLIFSEDRLSGYGGCNAISTTFTTDGTTIRIGAIASTRMMCEDMPRENRIIKALSEVRSFVVDKDQLYLLGERETDTILSCRTEVQR